MRLHSLTIQGFKSFPTKTRLRFSSGISAVVGPNGCGKSNIVDAVRWVLGEQSPRMLRAKSMEDIIYSGANGYRPALAEVRLLLAGCDIKNVPGLEGESEIEIVRRLNRSGESEYRINGRQCRRKDILYLFMDTGAGTRAYSIVDQGQIGAFVEMGGEERRALLEEAAGVARYRARRVEAQKKLDRTAENLERLEDIVAEVRSRSKVVARQAERARRYLELRGREERLEKGRRAFEWSRLASLERELMERAARYEDELSGIGFAISSLSASLEALEMEEMEVEDALSSARDRAAQVEQAVEAARRVLAEREREELALLSRLDVSARRAEELRRQEGGARRRREALSRELEARRRDAVGLEERLREAQAGLDAALASFGGRRETLEELKDRLLDLSAAHARAESAVKGVLRELELARQRKERRLEELSRLGEGRASLESALEDVVKAEQEGRSRLSLLSGSLYGVERSLDRLMRRHQELKEGLDRVERRMASVEAAKQALERIEERGEGVPEGSRFLLAKGFPCMAVDCLDVAPGWETAVEAVLGPGLYAVVCASGQARQAIDFLVEGKFPSVRLLMQDGQWEPQWVGGDSERLSCLVKAREGALGALHAFLGIWIVYPDADTMLADLEGGGPPAFRVAADGSLAYPWGEVVLRNPGAKEEGLLSRRAKVASLSRELEALGIERERLAGESEEVGAELSGLEERRRILQREMAQFERELKSLLQKRQGIEAKLEAGMRQEEVLGLELSELDQRMTELSGEVAVLEEKAEELAKEKEGLEAQVRELQLQVKQGEELVDAAREQVEEVKIRLAGLSSEIEGLERERERVGRRLESLAREGAEVARAAEEVRAAATEAAESLASARGRLSFQEEELERRREEGGELEERLRGMRRSLDALRMERGEKEAARRRLESRLHSVKLELTKVTEQKRSIQSICFDDFREDVAARCEEWLIEGMGEEAISRELEGVKDEIDRLLPVNLTAFEEHEALEKRLAYLEEQRQDLEGSISDLRSAIRRINATCRERLSDALEKVNANLAEVFPLLFNGGTARLVVQEEEDILETGVAYMVQLPGKRLQHLGLLSGGEKALAALALIFAFFFLRSSPFCLLDEVDAPLDDANTVRFTRLLKTIAQRCQVILITHNQRVMEAADTLFGVTMEESGVSKLVSVDLVEG